MAFVRMVQPTVDQVVDMISVRNRGMSAAGTVHVTRLMGGGGFARRAAIRIRVAHLKLVFHDQSIRILMMQVAIVQIVDVAVMRDPHMTAPGTMLMRMVPMNCRHVMNLREKGTEFHA
jgi:hypothetical protein